MSSQVEYEAYNVTFPMQNTLGMKDLAAVLVTQTTTGINLSDYFGNLGAGHFFTLQADGAKVYIAGAAGLSTGIGTGINEQAAGNGAQVCWPIPDGQQLPVRFVTGREAGTGYATMANVASGFVLHCKLAVSGVATGWLRILRSSVGPSQGLEQFKPPGFPVPISF